MNDYSPDAAAARPDEGGTGDSCGVCGMPMLAGTIGGQCAHCLLSLAATCGMEAGLSGQEGLLDDMQARCIGDYELIEEIARGGMGVVYRARQLSLDREVAVKMILAGDLASPAARRMFQNEARAAATLHHPNIVPVYETGEHEMRHFFSMRFVPGGRTIAHWAAERRGSHRMIAAAAAQIARAVAHAHERGVLHRDLKPSNVLWDTEAGPQVTDFGLAKLLEAKDAAITGSALMAGSPCYMAPEQVDGGEVTTATDLYGIGAVLYELLAGKPPFMGRTVVETARKVKEEQPASLPGVPRDLRTICLKCLAKRPQDRYASAAALADDLERFSRGEPVSAVPLTVAEHMANWARRKPKQAALIGVTLLSLVGGIAGVFWQWLRAETANTDLRSTVARLEWRRIVRLIEDGQNSRGLAELARLLRAEPAHPHASSLALSVLETRGFALPLSHAFNHGPGSDILRASFTDDGMEVRTIGRDGRVLRWDGETGAALGQSAAIAPVALPDPFSDETRQGKVTSPDGTRVAVWSPDGLTIRSTAGNGGPEIVCNEASGVIRVTWSPDGSLLAAASFGGSSARIWNASSGLPVTARLPHLYGCTSLAFTPDGSFLLTGSTEGVVRRWKAGSGEAAPAASIIHADSVMDLAISPDGSRLLATQLPWNARSPQSGGSAQLWDLRPRLPDALHFSAGSQTVDGKRQTHTAIAWSKDGAHFAVATAAGLLSVHDADGCEPLWASQTKGYPRGISFLPGGRLGVSTTAGEIILYSAMNGEVVAGPWSTHRLETAFFHPGGRHLLTGGFEGQVELWDLDSGTIFSRATSHAAPVNGVALSPDASLIASAGEDGRLIVSDAATGRAVFPAVQAADEIMSARFSPDGRWIVTASQDRTAQIRAALTGAPRCPPLRHEGELAHASFDPTGQRILTVGRDGIARVWDAATGEPLGEAMRHQTAVRSASFSPDGRRVLTEDHDGLRLWDTATGEPLTLTLPHPAGIGIGYDAQGLRALFNPDGTRVLHATATRDAILWNVPEPPAPAPDWLPDLLEAVACLALDARGAPVPVPPERWLELQKTLRSLDGADFYESWGRRFAR